MSISAPSVALLAALRKDPNDEPLRERAAHALDLEGKPAEAVALLGQALRNLTAHEKKTPLPCLCKKCLVPATVAAQADGATFRRDFAVAQGRVLFYWVPEEVEASRAEVARSVGSALRTR